MLAVPLQGLAASTLFGCGMVHSGPVAQAGAPSASPCHEGAPQEGAPGDAGPNGAFTDDTLRAAAVGDDAAGDETFAEGALTADPADEATVTDEAAAAVADDGDASRHATTGCSACAACCSLLALPAATAAVPGVPPAVASASRLPLAEAAFITGGPDRPPPV